MRRGRSILPTAAALMALLVAVPGSAQEPAAQETPPTVAPDASETAPPPPPPPPPPQSGTRVVATRVGSAQRGSGGAIREVRLVVMETEVAGVSGGWSVTASAADVSEGSARGAVRPHAVTVTGRGGVPRASLDEGDFGAPTTMLEVAGQSEDQVYDAHYLTLGDLRFGPETVPGRPVVTVTLIQ